MSFSQLLQAHGDPIKTAAALGLPAPSAPVVLPAPTIQQTPLASPTLSPSTIVLNVDRTPAAALAPASAPARATAEVTPVTMPAPFDWRAWMKAHALWLLVALLVLLLIAYGARSKPAPSGFRPSRMVKGSPEARAHMAAIRKRRT